MNLLRNILSIKFLLVFGVTLAQNNLLDTSSWIEGNGSVAGFNRMGTDAENVRETGIDPFGNNSVLWKASPDTGNNNDGGWQTPYINIDETKTYRLTVWIKKTNSNGGQTRFGFQSRNASNAFSNLRTDGSALNTPYFFNGDLPILDKWYLLVGYVHSSNYAGNEILSGVYDPDTGTKVLDASTDFKFAPGAVTIRHRTWLRGTTNTADFQFMSEPTIYEINGQEPSVADLINPNTGNPGGTSLWTAQDDDIYYTNGNVSIGTIDVPDGFIVAVDGKLITEEVLVQPSGSWPDYVFRKDYDLPSLEELQSFIDKNGHLPNIPSSLEVEANGIELGEMNKLLLEKIEQLTLYLIQLKKENTHQQKQIEKLLHEK